MPFLIIFIVIVFWIVRAVARAKAIQGIVEHQVNAYNHQVNAYNQAVEQQLNMLAAALRAQQPDVQTRRRQVQRQIRRMPAEERKPYEDRLDRVMSSRTRLNPRTGEWEEL